MESRAAYFGLLVTAESETLEEQYIKVQADEQKNIWWTNDEQAGKIRCNGHELGPIVPSKLTRKLKCYLLEICKMKPLQWHINLVPHRINSTAT